MRQIKFRAWDKKTKEYFHISELWNSGTNPECFNFDGWTDNFGDEGRLKDIVIEQFTGMTDVNGNDIYEGDIVENERGEILRVSYSAIDASFVAGNCYFGSIGAGKEIRIIGNVHANPELSEE